MRIGFGSGSSVIFDLLAQVAEYASNCHLVIASRMLPNLRGIARLGRALKRPHHR